MQIAAREILTAKFGQKEWWGFYVEALEAGATVSMAKAGSPPTVSLEYSVDGGSTWSSFDANGGTTTVTLAKVRSRAYFRAVTTNARLASSTSAYHKFVLGKSVAVGGNVLSLLSRARIFAFPSTVSSAYYCLFGLFYGATTLVDASALVLPDSAMPQYCYYQMFFNCSKLTAAPALPATTMAGGCYFYMFRGCTSLTAAPALPATTLAGNCYREMFRGCTSLTAAPALPATTLADGCYSSMFNSCSKLTAAPELPATTLAVGCYQEMFYGCSKLTATPALPATTLEFYCYRQMFYNCDSLTAAPELPATTLEAACYQEMFYGCSNLRQITTAHKAWNPTSATTNWVSKVSSSGTFTCPSALPQTRGVNYIPTSWTIVTT